MVRILTESDTEVTQVPYPFVAKEFVAVHCGDKVHIMLGEKYKLITLDEFDSYILNDDTSLDEFFPD